MNPVLKADASAQIVKYFARAEEKIILSLCSVYTPLLLYSHLPKNKTKKLIQSFIIIYEHKFKWFFKWN